MTGPDDQAFPAWRQDKQGMYFKSRGLTKRECFAALAMHDIVSSTGYPFTAEEIARRAIELADAILVQLNKMKKSQK